MPDQVDYTDLYAANARVEELRVENERLKAEVALAEVRGYQSGKDVAVKLQTQLRELREAANGLHTAALDVKRYSHRLPQDVANAIHWHAEDVRATLKNTQLQKTLSSAKHRTCDCAERLKEELEKT